MLKNDEFIRKFDEVQAHNYHPLPLVVEKAKGSWVWDLEGNKYLDCLACYSALNQGHGHPKILKAMMDQCEKVTLTSRAFHNDQLGPFLKMLTELSGLPKGLPMNTGTEAVETALKAARQWGYQVKKVPENQAEILVCDHNFHGRTIGIISFSDEAMYRKDYGPYLPGFKIIPYGDADALEKAITPNTVGFLMEPIQGEAGVRIPPTGYLKKAQEICKKNNVLLMLDEIQSGLGRTGKLFAYQHETETPPDLLILGKALGGGYYPVSAVLGRDDILSLFRPGSHGSTFGGNPLACAVAQASIDVILDEKLSEQSEKMGLKLNTFLQGLQKKFPDVIREVRCRGLWAGIELFPNVGGARKYCERLMKLGVLCKDTRVDTFRLAPPLVLTEDEFQFLLGSLEKAFTL